MKRNTSKLALRRETLKVLGERTLAEVVGGVASATKEEMNCQSVDTQISRNDKG